MYSHGMPHFVLLDESGKVLGAAVNTTREKADTIAAHLTDQREGEGYVPRYAIVHAKEVQAYDPQPVKVGNKVSGAVANTLPRGSAIVCVGGPHVTTGRLPHALLRGVVGYIQVDHTEGPVDEDARFEILHIGR
jgi:hypothetical protein